MCLASEPTTFGHRRSSSDYTTLAPTYAFVRKPQDILNIQSISLQVVINKYHDNTESLQDNERLIVARAIVEHLLGSNSERMYWAFLLNIFELFILMCVSWFFRITRQEFVEISQAIVSLFPTEIPETYYRPSYKLTQAQRKLYTAYTKYRVQRRECNLVCKRTMVRSKAGKIYLKIECVCNYLKCLWYYIYII